MSKTFSPSCRARIAWHKNSRQLIEQHAADILCSEGMQLERKHIQHGRTTVFSHSFAVTHACATLARRLRIPVHERALIRGALLHDYFLYDWHEKNAGHNLHGFFHPTRACHNAVRDFNVGEVEQNMIKHHMFPLVPLPPTCREAVLLCLVDKYIATIENFDGFKYKYQLLMRRHAR